MPAEVEKHRLESNPSAGSTGSIDFVPAGERQGLRDGVLANASRAAERLQELIEDEEIMEENHLTLGGEISGEGIGVIEAPRGTLFHHYKTDEKGLLTDTNLGVARACTGTWAADGRSGRGSSSARPEPEARPAPAQADDPRGNRGR